MVYMVTFTINISPMLAYIPYMDPMGIDITPGPATSSPNPNMSQVHPPKHPLQH